MAVREPGSWHLPLPVTCYLTFQLRAGCFSFPPLANAIVCCVFNDLICNKLGRWFKWDMTRRSHAQAEWTDGAPQQSACQHVQWLQEIMELTNRSQVSRCYLYANEGGGKNCICIEKSTHSHVEILSPVFSFLRFCPCACIYVAGSNEREMMGEIYICHNGIFLFCSCLWQRCGQKASITQYCLVYRCSRGTTVKLRVDGGGEAWLWIKKTKKNSPLSGMSNFFDTHERRSCGCFEGRKASWRRRCSPGSWQIRPCDAVTDLMISERLQRLLFRNQNKLNLWLRLTWLLGGRDYNHAALWSIFLSNKSFVCSAVFPFLLFSRRVTYIDTILEESELDVFVESKWIECINPWCYS